ncbi:MAG: multiprotein bridging factor aMBF1 [Conexivisphaerales archaeon]
MICELCGKAIIGKPYRIYVEGAYMTVCESCAKYGKPADSVKPLIGKHVDKVKKTYQDIPEYEIIDNYGQIIRNIREEMGLTQDKFGLKCGIKPSLLAKIEQQRIIPDYQTLRKLETSLKIKLMRQPTSL